MTSTLLVDAYLTALGVLLAIAHTALGLALLAWAADRLPATRPVLRMRAQRNLRRIRRNQSAR